MTTEIQRSRSEIRELIPALESSGQTVAAFAREHGIPAHRLYWARRQARAACLRDEGGIARAAFREVVVADQRSDAGSPIELRLPSGISIRVSADFDEVALRRLLGLLAPC